MSKIAIDSHDFLGKLTTIKNHLFVALEKEKLPQKTKRLLKLAYQANEELIEMVKKGSNETNLETNDY